MTAIPSTDQVQAYLAAYQIESVVEEAVNDAVLKQVKVRLWPRLAPDPPLDPRSDLTTLRLTLAPLPTASSGSVRAHRAAADEA